MEKEIKILYVNLHAVSVEYLTGINRNNIKIIRELMPEIQKFASYFLDDSQFAADPEVFWELSEDFVQILKDIVEALEQEDHVLLHDSIAYGLLDYLKLFMEQEEQADDDV